MAITFWKDYNPNSSLRYNTKYAFMRVEFYQIAEAYNSPEHLVEACLRVVEKYSVPKPVKKQIKAWKEWERRDK